MILRAGAYLLGELHDELAKKTLVLWNSRSPKNYDQYVPWMSCVPRADDMIVDHPALSDSHKSGALVYQTEQLRNINEYLQLSQADRIAFDLFKNMKAEEAKHPIAKEVVDENVLEAFVSAKDAVIKSSPLFETLFDRLVHAVIPLRVSESQLNGSSDLARGAIFISFFASLNQWNLQLDLAHEFGHQALMILNSADPLIDSDIATPVYSGVRMTNRPAIQSLHAATALAFMILFTLEKTESVARQETVSMVQELDRTIAALRKNCVMTELGNAILDDYQQLCEELQPRLGEELFAPT